VLHPAPFLGLLGGRVDERRAVARDNHHDAMGGPGTIQVKGKHAIRKMRTPQLVLNGADGDPLRTVAGALFPQ
jgi:hypothetical protein